MGIYVDIDLDYLVKPVEKESINNIRIYNNNKSIVDNVEMFVNKLDEKGLLGTSNRKFFTNHRKSYTYWWIAKRQNMTVIHIDAHSDLYRNRNSDLTMLRDTDMGCDDYIWYAIRDGFISKLYWVVPENLYDLSSSSIVKRFIPENMIKYYIYENEILNIIFNVKTRLGNRIIDYKICTIENLPQFKMPELITVATSPEFIPQSADNEIFKALELLGAGNDEIERIKRMHSEMPQIDSNSIKYLYRYNKSSEKEYETEEIS